MAGRLAGKVALVTGASGGIGQATALALAREGADVAITARRAALLDELAAELSARGVRALAAPGDAAQEDDVNRVVEQALAAFGRVDILVNNVGIARYAPLSELTLADYDWMMDTNMRSTFLFTKALFPGMVERREGTIILIGSVSSLTGLPNETVYAASKHAQLGFATALDHEAYPHNVRVTLIAPGGVQTDHALGMGRTPGDPHLDTLLNAEDVAAAVVFAATQPARSRVFLLGLRPMSESAFE